MSSVKNAKNIITLVTLVEDVALISLSRIPAKTAVISEIFADLADNGINVDLITQSVSMGGDISLSFTVSNDDVPKVLTVTRRLREQNAGVCADVSVGNFKLSFFSENMRRTIGVAAYLFGLFKDNGLELKLISTSETDISCLFDNEFYDKALALTRETFGRVAR